MPLQSVAAEDALGQIELLPGYEPALKDLDGFSHIWIVSHLHRSEPPTSPVVMPFLDDVERGLLATRSPRHPNPIGLSVVRLLAVAGANMDVAGLDLLDGTPVLDIKPYVPLFDAVAAERTGWLEQSAEKVHSVRADARFEELVYIVEPPAPTRWTITRTSGPEELRRGVLLAPQGKTLRVGDTLTLPPDPITRWRVLEVDADEHGAIATVEVLT